MIVRRLEPRDASAYRALMLRGYDAHPDAFTATVAEREQLPMFWWENRLRVLEAPSEIVFGAFIGGVLAGVVGLQFNDRPKTRHKAWLFGMYVERAHSGCGAGRALVQAALAYAAERGALLVQLTVTEGNARAQDLYERAGFLTFGVEPYAVCDDAGCKSKVHMWRPLAQFGSGAGRFPDGSV